MLKRMLAFCTLLLICLCSISIARNVFFAPSTQQNPDMANSDPLNIDSSRNSTDDRKVIENRDFEKYHMHHTSPAEALDIIIEREGITPDTNINLLVDIETRTLFFRYDERVLKQYRISTGTRTDLGDKEVEGDFRTPRGEFYICSKRVYSPPKNYIGSRWMLLSYPNIAAAERGLNEGMINEKTYRKIVDQITSKKTPLQDTSLGSAIGIHGGAVPGISKDWTAGCIGMYDEDVEEIYKYVKAGTMVVIR